MMSPATAHSYRASFPTQPSVALHTCGNNQWVPRIEHSWHCRAYIFHTQATVLQNTPAHPVPFPAPGPAVVPSLLPSFPPTLSVFEPFFTSVAGPWQAYCSDKIHDYALENLIEKRRVVKTEARGRKNPAFLFPTHTLPFFCQWLTHNGACSQTILLWQQTIWGNCMPVSDIQHAMFTQVGHCWVESYCDDKGFPQQWQGQISGRRHTQSQGEASSSCQNCKRAEPKAQVGRRGWTV